MNSNIGQNIRLIRKALNLSVKRYAELTGVSKATIVNVEQGHTGLKIQTIEQLVSFSEYTVDQLKGTNFIIAKNFRERLFAKYKDNTELREYFMKQPKIIDAINEHLIKSSFFTSFRETHEIVDYFDNIGWKILGTSLQNELKNHPQVHIEKHPTKKNTNLYKKSRSISPIL